MCKKSSYFYAPKFYNPLQNLLFLKLPISSSEPAHILCSSCTTFSCIKFKFTRSQLVEKEVMIKWDFLGKMWSHKISALPEASAALTAWLLPRKYYGFRQLSSLKQCTYLLEALWWAIIESIHVITYLKFPEKSSGSLNLFNGSTSHFYISKVRRFPMKFQVNWWHGGTPLIPITRLLIRIKAKYTRSSHYANSHSAIFN